jgi:Histidine kinase/7TM diverse intracellular signalling
MHKGILFLLFVSVFSPCQGQVPIVLNGAPKWKTGIDISGQALVFEEFSNNPQTLQQVKTQPFVPFHESSARHSRRPLIIKWLKFIVTNISTADTVSLILNMNAHYNMKLYREDQLINEQGTSVQEQSTDRIGLPFYVLPGSRDVYWVRMEERIRYLTPLFIHLETPYIFFYERAEQHFRERWLKLLLPIMAGILLLISIFGLYQFYLLGDRAYLYYFFYAFSAFLFAIYCMEDRFDLMFLGNTIKNICDAVLYTLVTTGYLFFVSTILKMTKHFPRLWLILKLLLAISIVQATISLGEYAFGAYLFKSNLYYSFLSGIPVLTISSILLYSSVKSNSPVKKFLVAGLGSLIAFFFLPISFGFVNFYDSTPEMSQIINYGPFWFVMGITIESICFALALAYRNKLVVDENRDMQVIYTRQLEEELNNRTLELQQRNRTMEEQRIKQLQAEFDHKIAETEMTALRAQMNPHFIFNCLNSIKLYTLENDSKTASEYLTIFSQLIRLVLENSRSEKISLQKELETLRLYIELEAMRFKNKVKYKIVVDENIDQAYIEIPPLLLQPYVENAIWHGLMHKREGGLIEVRVSSVSEKYLHIEISDDGIGRQLAMEYRSKSATRTKSFGLKMTSERILTINQVYDTNTSVEIIDKRDDMDKACGTKVIIEIPI